jgi:hypothetical protein
MEITGRLQQIYNSIEKTHPRLGKLAIMELICETANKALLVIGTSGTGKSAVMKWLNKNISRSKVLMDSVTVSGLKHIQKILNGANMTILVDDISKGGTEYSQVQTIATLGELSYSGFIKKYTLQLAIEIENFNGAVIMNGQPLIIKRVLSAPEFETDIRDKVVRYYHLPRPINPTLSIPEDGIDHEYDIKHIFINPKTFESEDYKKALENFLFEFTKGRAVQHLNDMLKATALLQGRTEVNEEDVKLVEYLSRNFRIEREIFYKRDLEGARILDPNVLPLLSIISTYKTRKIEDIMIEFQVKKARAYEIVAENSSIAQFKDGVLIPTAETIELLKAIGEW